MKSDIDNQAGNSEDRRMKNKYGTLCDYKTSNSIRPATEDEWRASREAEQSNIGGGTGVIE